MTTSAALLYLAGGVLPAARFLLFSAGIVFPLAALLTSSPLASTLTPEKRALLGLCLAFVAVAPLFYVRRALPLPGGVLDLVALTLLSGAALMSGSYLRWLRDLYSPRLRPAALTIFVGIPLIFALAWAGFEVISPEAVRYYGLFVIDFGNLTSIVSLLKASPGLPLLPVEGSGSLTYHWFYFTFPAWVSTFAGGDMPNSRALILCNLETAALLFIALVESARAGASAHLIRLPHVAAAVVAFASFVTYFEHGLVRVFGVAMLALPDGRNYHLLPIVQGMVDFGNNTFAVALALMILLLLDEWNQSGEGHVLGIVSFLLLLLTHYSVTLFPPMVVTLGVWALSGRIRRPAGRASLWLALGVSLASAMVCVPVFYELRILSEGSRGFAFGYDAGHFVRRLAVGMCPLWFIAGASVLLSRRWDPQWILVLTAIILPSFFYVRGTWTGGIDLSLKVSSLIAAATAPMIASGLAALWERRSLLRWPLYLASVLIAMGFVNTAAYSLQFATYRTLGIHSRSVAVPFGYFEALEYLRTATPPQSIVIDPASVMLDHATSTLMIGERRILLPTRHTRLAIGATAEERGRVHDFETWERSGFEASDLCLRFAEAGDYLLLPGSPVLDEHWERIWQSRAYTLYRSRQKSGLRSSAGHAATRGSP